jgi:hypothetical protein
VSSKHIPCWDVRRSWQQPLHAACASACIALSGCVTHVAVTPQVADKNPPRCQIRALVSYDGKAEYLPTALLPDTTASSGTLVRYSFAAQYGLKEMSPFLQIVNPLLIVGFPTGSDSIVVTGQVDMLRGETVLRSYAAAASMKRSGSIFSEGDTFTEMRRRGLLLVRDNLSSQLCKDEAVLASLLSSSATH